jgi:CelD/BcsL family acetyltransferase involved in cellulose biosynthesis
LRASSEFETLSIDQYVNAVSIDERVLSPLVIVLREDGKVKAILPFAVYLKPKKFVIGELRLFSIPHKVLHAICAMIGDLDLTQARLVARELAKGKLYDAINLYEVPTDHTLFKVVQEKSLDLKVSSAVHDVFPHWIVDFPESFDAYLAVFKSKRRKAFRRNIRQFQEAHEVVFEKLTESREINRFLETGESISRQTYQWDLGTRLVNNAQSRRTLEICARQNELYCYLLHADGVAIAFAWGHLINNVFHYETPGFLREYSRWSPGTIILLKIFEDLIENTTCRHFDFGMGGDFTGYKSQFGNNYYNASVVEFYPCKTFKSWLLYLLDRLFGLVKRVLRRLVSPQLKSRVKQILRKFSILK